MSEKMFNPDYLKHLCQKYGLVPSKKYGQNYLISPEPIEAMIEAAEIKKEDTVIEIGPGFGALTFALAAKAKKVMAFEIEKKLQPYWAERLAQNKNIEIIWGNILREVESLESIKSVKYKVVANLPYQITSEVIRKFLSRSERDPAVAGETQNNPEMMVFMVQKEVAERICAVAGDMSVLAVSVQLYAEPEIIMPVPRSSFWPEPKVDSAVIKIRSRELGVGSSEPDKQFFQIVKAGFANRRKMLIKNLSAVMDKNKLKTIFAELGLNEKVRAQELSIEQWKQLVANLSF